MLLPLLLTSQHGLINHHSSRMYMIDLALQCKVDNIFSFLGMPANAEGAE